MAIFKVEGGHRLHGSITPQGAKNGALRTDSAPRRRPPSGSTVHNIPQILDVMQLIELLRRMGVEVEQLAEDTYSFCAREIRFRLPPHGGLPATLHAPARLGDVIGPMLARFGVGYIPKPGGDKIGRRRLDTHFLGFQKLGAKFDFDIADEFFMVEGKELKGTYMLLDEASVTGTANIVMAAVLAKGFDDDLQRRLRALPAAAVQDAQPHGRAHLGHRVEPADHRGRRVARRHGAHAAARHDRGGQLHRHGRHEPVGTDRSRNVSFENLGIIPAQFARMGIRFEQRDDDIYIPQQEHYSIDTFLDGSIMTIADAPWPGLTPDLLSIFLVVATQAKGAVLIHQKMFESRLFFVDKLIDMGAQIILCDPHRATVIGHDHRIRLRATRMTSPDIRAGVALLIAAMSAEGVSTIQNIDQIDRGYKDIDGRLNALGARITRIDDCE